MVCECGVCCLPSGCSRTVHYPSIYRLSFLSFVSVPTGCCLAPCTVFTCSNTWPFYSYHVVVLVYLLSNVKIVNAIDNQFLLSRYAGKHNGSVQGVSYFKCKPKHGVFVRLDKIMKAPNLSSAKPTINSSVSTSSLSRSPATTRHSSVNRRTSLGSAATATYRQRRGGLKWWIYQILLNLRFSNYFLILVHLRD